MAPPPGKRGTQTAVTTTPTLRAASSRRSRAQTAQPMVLPPPGCAKRTRAMPAVRIVQRRRRYLHRHAGERIKLHAHVRLRVRNLGDIVVFKSRADDERDLHSCSFVRRVHRAHQRCSGYMHLLPRERVHLPRPRVTPATPCPAADRAAAVPSPTLWLAARRSRTKPR